MLYCVLSKRNKMKLRYKNWEFQKGETKMAWDDGKIALFTSSR